MDEDESLHHRPGGGPGPHGGQRAAQRGARCRGPRQAPAQSAQPGNPARRGRVRFDRNWNDDILDRAVGAMLAAKPSSPVVVLADGARLSLASGRTCSTPSSPTAVLADGSVPPTAFLPTDRAFRRLASDLTGKSYTSESAVLTDVASLGIPTIDTALLYHVVPGATITYRAALKSDGATLGTALSVASITVKVRCCSSAQFVAADQNDANPFVVRRNLNKGNRQMAHGIDRVLRPADL